MPIPTLSAWKSDTHKWFSRRNGAIGAIDAALGAWNRSQTTANLRALSNAIEAFRATKTTKHGDWRASGREGANQNITRLADAVAAQLGAAPGDNGVATIVNVCGKLMDVRIADVDFSDNVRAAARAKMLGGRSLYDIVKAEWDTNNPDTIDNYQAHEASMMQAKLKTALPFGPQTIPLGELDKIAAVVRRHRFAVCESITATIISMCKGSGFAGQMEWVGIPYGKKTGHSIVVANRAGQLADPTTWGDDCVIVDLWYYNLGMRPQYVYYGGRGLDSYITNEITPWLGAHGGLKLMAQIP